MNWLKGKLAILSAMGFLMATVQVFAANHVRVILDTSGSMVHNDQPRLAALSTILLFDLAKPNLTMDDTFAVMTFDRSTPEWRSGPPPVVQKPWIRAVRDQRAELVNAIRGCQYDAPHTYYFPFLSAAIVDLKQQARKTSDRRVIILVTDGVPEDPDTGMIQRELVPQLRRENIQLYILALGPQAASHTLEIEQAIGGTNVGQLFVDPDGSRVPENMIAIFSRSFGYTAQLDKVSGGSASLDLEAQQHPDRVAVVLYWKQPNRPELHLEGPSSAGVNNPDSVRGAEETGGSYALSWVLAPSPGHHRLQTTAEGARVAVLRPARLVIEIQPQAANTPIYAAIAMKALPLRVMLRSIGGNLGDPGPVKLWFQVHGPRRAEDFEWSDDEVGAAGDGIPTQEGRYFDIFPQFSRNPEAPQAYYNGYITLQVRRPTAVIGELSGEHAFHVLVFPFLQITTEPPFDYAGVNGQRQALGPQVMGCTSFRFHLEGNLPHPNQDHFSLQAVIAPNPQIDRGLAEAQYLLDHEALSYGSNSALWRGNWLTGHSMDRHKLLETQHLICVLPGRASRSDYSRTQDLNVQFKLLEAPYDEYQAIGPFQLKVLLGPPTWTQKYSGWLAASLALLFLILQLWYQRFRPEVPRNLRSVSTAPPGGLEPLGKGSLTRRLLGLVVEREVVVENGNYTLGWVRPVTHELYRFRPARGVVLEGADDDANGMISVNRSYRARSNRGDYQLQLRYE